MSASSVASVSASLAGLSFRQRSMRGKRTAIPDRCRVDGAMASKPSSNTWIGSTCRTGPKRSTVWRRIQRSISSDLLVGQARVGLGHRHQLAFVPHAEGVVGEQAGALARARLRVDQHRVDGVRIDLPLPPVAALAADAVGGRQALQHQALDAAVARLAAQAASVVPGLAASRRATRGSSPARARRRRWRRPRTAAAAPGRGRCRCRAEGRAGEGGPRSPRGAPADRSAASPRTSTPASSRTS